MLDVIREYAGEALAASDETDGAAAAHAAYFLGVAEEAERALGGASQEEWYERIAVEHENMRAAIRWLLRRAEADPALRLTGALWQFWRVQGLLAEGRMWLREALRVDGSTEPATRARALWGASWLAFHSGDFDEAHSLSEQLQPLARSIGDPGISRNALTVEGIVTLARGRAQAAMIPLRECVEICRKIGRDWFLATSLLNLGMATMHGADPSDAEPLLEEAEQIYREIGDDRFAARSVGYMGHAALLQGDIDAARAHFVRALTVFRDREDLQGIAEGLEAMSAIFAAENEPVQAARIAGAAGSVRERIAARPFPFDRDTIDKHLDRARSSIAGDVWDVAWREGRATPLDQAIRSVLGDD
jgi:tetratricopeptide (TPR) repeat protein